MAERDRWLGGLWGLLAVACLAEAKEVWNGWDGTGVMLLIIGSVFLVLAISFIFAPVIVSNRVALFSRAEAVHVGVTASSFALYVLLMAQMGYFLSTWAFLLGLATYIARRRFLITVVWTGAVAVLSYVVFKELLGVYLPSGPFGI